MSEKNNKKLIKKKILFILVGIILTMIIGIGVWMAGTYKPQSVAKEALISDGNVEVVMDEFISFTPKNTEVTKGFIFYPGAKVEAECYAPMAKKIAEKGYEVVIVKMPLNFAMLSSNKAEKVIKRYPNIKNWTIGGHSLGGVSASKFASENDNVEGVVFLASYPAGDELKNSNKKVISIWGSNDTVINSENLEESKNNLPSDTVYVEIEGGNHGQFGDYGKQKGDSDATISEEQQLEITVNSIIDNLNR